MSSAFKSPAKYTIPHAYITLWGSPYNCFEVVPSTCLTLPRSLKKITFYSSFGLSTCCGQNVVVREEKIMFSSKKFALIDLYCQWQPTSYNMHGHSIGLHLEDLTHYTEKKMTSKPYVVPFSFPHRYLLLACLIPYIFPFLDP